MHINAIRLIYTFFLQRHRANGFFISSVYCSSRHRSMANWVSAFNRWQATGGWKPGQALKLGTNPRRSKFPNL